MALATITLEVEHRFPDLEKRHKVLNRKKNIQKLTFSSLFLFQIPYLGSEIKYDNIYLSTLTENTEVKFVRFPSSNSSVWQKNLLTKLIQIPSFKIQQKCIKMLLKPVYYNGGITSLLSLVLIEEARIKQCLCWKLKEKNILSCTVAWSPATRKSNSLCLSLLTYWQENNLSNVLNPIWIWFEDHGNQCGKLILNPLSASLIGSKK